MSIKMGCVELTKIEDKVFYVEEEQWGRITNRAQHTIEQMVWLGSQKDDMHCSQTRRLQ